MSYVDPSFPIIEQFSFIGAMKIELVVLKWPFSGHMIFSHVIFVVLWDIIRYTVIIIEWSPNGFRLIFLKTRFMAGPFGQFKRVTTLIVRIGQRMDDFITGPRYDGVLESANFYSKMIIVKVKYHLNLDNCITTVLSWIKKN